MRNETEFPFFLVGRQEVFESESASEEMLVDFYSGAFSLREKIHNLGSPFRRIAYECAPDGNTRFLFVGYQVQSAEGLPDESVCWKLDADTLSIFTPSGGTLLPRITLPIEWRWQDTVSLHGRTWKFGDFFCNRMTIPGLIDFTDEADCWLSFNIFEDSGKDYAFNDQIQLSQYNPAWPNEYASFADWLKSYFGSDIIRRTEHFGSTAIPGIAAKPIIDVLVEIPSFAAARRGMLPRLSENWEYCWYGNHMMLIRRDSFMGARTHHLHLAPADHNIWERLSFRDYLRAHPQDAARYSDLKKNVVTRFRNDRERYTWSKGDFVGEITRKALQWAKSTDSNSE